VPYRRARVAALVVAVTAGVAAAPLGGGPAAAALGPKWTPVPGAQGPLRDVSVALSGEVWVVGDRSDTGPLSAYWNGSAWTAIPVPGTGDPQDRTDLQAVDAAGPGAVWAVGSVRSAATSVTSTLILRLDRHTWFPVPSPSPSLPGQASVLTDIDMTFAGAGWAVGWTAPTAKSRRPLLLRWTAEEWVEVAPPASAARSAELKSVHVVSADDVWAVGSQVRPDDTVAPLVLHWDGSTWREELVGAAADPSAAEQSLVGVAAGPDGGVWAVGRTCRLAGTALACRALALHRDQGAWRAAATGPATEFTEVVVNGLEVWAVGYAGLTPTFDTEHVEIWDGARFVPEPLGLALQGEPASALTAGAAAPVTGELWVVGWADEAVGGGARAAFRD